MAERVMFFILNKTQKGLNPSHKDQLAYRIWYSGIRGIPIIEEEEWRAHATRIVEALNKNQDSPVFNLIADATAAGMGRRVRLSSFVTSLNRLFASPVFFDVKTEEQDEKFWDRQFIAEYEYVARYWKILKEMFSDAFDHPKDQLLLRSLSVYALNWLAADIFNWCKDEGIDPSSEQIKRFLRPLANFDWSKDKSEIKAFGGHQGANSAYQLLLKKMDEGGIKQAKSRNAGMAENG